MPFRWTQPADLEARAIRGLAKAGAAATLLVLGNGEVRPYRQLAAQLGVGARVHFLGRRADVEAVHAAADLLVLRPPFSADKHLVSRLIYTWRDDYIAHRILNGRLI